MGAICADYAEWAKPKTEKIIDFVKTLQSEKDLGVLSALLSPERG
jgi:hypothetical protein